MLEASLLSTCATECNLLLLLLIVQAVYSEDVSKRIGNEPIVQALKELMKYEMAMLVTEEEDDKATIRVDGGRRSSHDNVWTSGVHNNLIASYRIALHRIALHCFALHRIALHCIASHRIASHCIASHCIAWYIVHCSTVLHITLASVALQSRLQHCTAH